jgi:hypothetical protein
MEKKTVFFGPFVGEFGWELLFWQGWVRRLCRTRYKKYRKIASSAPGRHPFYPDVDEFWPLPQNFLKIKYSARNYITDYWISRYPKPDIEADLSDVWPILEKIIYNFKKRLPTNTEFIHPWSFRYDQEDRRHYGIEMKNFPNCSSDKDFIVHSIPWSKQVLEPLEPTLMGVRILKKIINLKKKIIAIFPRERIYRRPDKNWQKEKYEHLIRLINKNFPEYQLAILGEPGGSFFSDGVPEGCIDLINIDSNSRMDVQLAVLKRADLALGGQSGGVSFAMASGCKTLSWGYAENEKSFRKENFTKTPFVFLLTPNPSVDLVMKYVGWLLGKDSMPIENIWRNFKIIAYRIFNPRTIHNIKKIVFRKCGIKS